MSDENQLQVSDVVAFAQAAKDNACAIVHPKSGQEADLFLDDEEWIVRASLKSAPTTVQRKSLKALMLKPQTREMIMRFGPNAGETIKLNFVQGTFENLETAASAAVGLVRLLAAEPDAWLWVAPNSFDDRGEPPAPPTVWPPNPGPHRK